LGFIIPLKLNAPFAFGLMKSYISDSCRFPAGNPQPKAPVKSGSLTQSQPLQTTSTKRLFKSYRLFILMD